jgi:hypothetical protein
MQLLVTKLARAGSYRIVVPSIEHCRDELRLGRPHPCRYLPEMIKSQSLCIGILTEGPVDLPLR